ncbi:MAG: pyridoxal phosphate-dependent aminotransferase [Terriglobia bacterium]
MPNKTQKLAKTILEVSPSRIRELANLALGMKDVLPLYFGESNAPTPQFIKDAAWLALQEGYTFYTHNAGLPSLRETIAEKYQELHAVRLDPQSEIVVTASGVQALQVAIRCLLDPGDEAILLTPAWPNASSIVQMCAGQPREIPLQLNGERYEIDFSGLRKALNARTRLLVYTSPSNPLGWVASEPEQSQLLAFCREHQLWLLADEVYERLYYRSTVAPSILRRCQREDSVVVVNSFSKTYNMTGWRLGWLAAPHALASKATEMNEFIVSHAPSMVQRAGETALRQGEKEITRMVASLQANRDYCLTILRTSRKLIVPQPEGAFYLFPRVFGLTDSFEFCRRLLLEKKVGIAPGVAFGAGGEGSVRICYAADRTLLEPALERFVEFVHTF